MYDNSDEIIILFAIKYENNKLEMHTHGKSDIYLFQILLAYFTVTCYEPDPGFENNTDTRYLLCRLSEVTTYVRVFKKTCVCLLHRCIIDTSDN